MHNSTCSNLETRWWMVNVTPRPQDLCRSQSRSVYTKLDKLTVKVYANN